MNGDFQLSPEENERQALERLRQRFERQGYTFMLHPDKSQVPDFLGSYKPDAIARSETKNVVVEVTRPRSAASHVRIEKIRRLFEGQPNWELFVVYSSSPDEQTIPTATPSDIRNRVSEAQRMADQGYRREAFISAWSLLEAALKANEHGKEGRPRTPGTVVQSLAMNGYIDDVSERRLRQLIQLRNRIVHGDVNAEPTLENVQQVLRAVVGTLATDATE